MYVRVVIVGMLLVCSLWTENALAGSSFLSPVQPKTQVNTKHSTTVLRWNFIKECLSLNHLPIEFTTDFNTDRSDNEIEIKFTVPFEVGMKISEEQYRDYGQILEKLMEDMLAEDNKETKI
uniref:Ghrelin and obestatin prepropeptide n=1 Tax=Varanus komodoensis TaxID=61221 RepID=A0A8D2J291_VARKO